jgi:hypothetical protein
MSRETMALYSTAGTSTFTVPAGAWEYKVALDDSWAENYGTNAQANGPNIALSLMAATSVKFYFDYKSKWATDNKNSRIVTAPGRMGAP